MSGSLTADARAETDLRPSEAESNKSVAASWTECSQPVVLLRSSGAGFVRGGCERNGRTFELVVGIAKAACAECGAGDGDAEGAGHEAGDRRVRERAYVQTAKVHWPSELAWKQSRHGGHWTSTPSHLPENQGRAHSNACCSTTAYIRFALYLTPKDSFSPTITPRTVVTRN